MPLRSPLSPEQEAAAKALAQAIRAAAAAELDELARTLVCADDAHLFGENEFRVRELSHKIAAKAFEQRLIDRPVPAPVRWLRLSAGNNAMAGEIRVRIPESEAEALPVREGEDTGSEDCGEVCVEPGVFFSPFRNA